MVLNLDACSLLRTKVKSSKIVIDFEGAFWIAGQLKEAAKKVNQKSFFRKIKGTDQMVWLVKHENSKG